MMALRLGKTQMEQISYWIPTVTGFGATATLGLLYFTDWKVVLQYMPIYNKKFKEEEGKK